jgi:hypothetical protein
MNLKDIENGLDDDFGNLESPKNEKNDSKKSTVWN